MTTAVTDQLLRDLVVRSHAEGTTCLAVAAAVEHQDRVLLVAGTGEDFEPVWSLPADRVLPGETLLHGLSRTVSLTTGLDVTAVTGYAGHHDRIVDGEVVRTFVFTVTAADPERVCRWANIGHRWSAEPVTACTILGAVEAQPTTNPAGAQLIGPTPIHQLSAALRAGARGLLCAEAAVELLIKDQSWLYRRDFVESFVDGSDPSNRDETGYSDIAAVDWATAVAALDADRLPCSSGEGQLLRIAASLAEGIPLDLHDAVTGLDSVNTDLVARAICRATGHRP